MARVNRTTGVALILGVILLVGTVTGVNVIGGSSKPAASGNLVLEGADVYGRGNAIVSVRASHPLPALPPGFSARVVSVDVKEMDHVNAGGVLFRLDDTQARAQLAKAEAARQLAQLGIGEAKEKVREHRSKISQQKRQITLAQSTWQKARAHWEDLVRINKGLDGAKETEVLMAQLDKEMAHEAVLGFEEILRDLEATDITKLGTAAEAKLAGAEAQVREAEALVNSLTLRAPADGVIQELNIGIGDTLGAPTMSPPITFQPDGPIVVRAEVEQERARNVREGMKVTMHLQSSDGAEEWTGVVERLAPVIAKRKSTAYAPDQIYDAPTRECIIRINPGQPELVPGTQMRVQIHTK